MTPPPSFFHMLLRPAILQILRATGYHAARPGVIDTFTDLAARYFLHLCRTTAQFATHNNYHHLPNFDGDGDKRYQVLQDPDLFALAPTPTIIDVRMALQHAGALLPERLEQEQEWLGQEDLRGLEAFIRWAASPINKEIKRVALDGNDEADDYLNALKKKHSKTDDDSKYMGTLLGRGHERGDVMVEGGDVPSILMWEEKLKEAAMREPHPADPGAETESSGTPLSSMEDRAMDDMEMELSRP